MSALLNNIYSGSGGADVNVSSMMSAGRGAMVNVKVNDIVNAGTSVIPSVNARSCECAR